MAASTSSTAAGAPRGGPPGVSSGAPAAAPVGAPASGGASGVSSGGAPGIVMADTVPNPTLYMSNLNDRIPLKELRACLYELCCAFGLVLDVNAGGKTRGQAFVVFGELSSATAALKGLQGKEFLGKPLRVQYAKNKSDAYLKFIDQYKPRKPNAPRTPVAAAAPKGESGSKGEGKFSLFVEDLPENVSRNSLDILFSQYKGHTDTRLVEGRGVAFVDFISKALAEIALQGLQGFKLTAKHSLRISHVDR